MYLVPLAVGVQMELFRRHRNITAGKKLCGSEKTGVAGSATSSLTMLACCLHHASDLLPAVGFILAASSFLIQHKDALITIGLIANAAGSAYIARAIFLASRSSRAAIQPRVFARAITPDSPSCRVKRYFL